MNDNVGGFTLDPKAFYTEEALRVMGLTSTVLRNAVDKGLLRCCSLSKRRRIYRGKAIIAWLSGEKPTARPTKQP
jgi:hypothetical protein